MSHDVSWGGNHAHTIEVGDPASGAVRMPSMNLHRGLFRVWIIASFVWLVSAGALLQKDIRRDVSTLMADRPAEITQNKTLPTPLTPPPGFVLENPSEIDKLRASLLAGTEDTRTPSQRAQNNLMLSAGVLLLPPILAFALGWAGLWIMRGFRS